MQLNVNYDILDGNARRISPWGMRFACDHGMAGLSFRVAEIIRKDTGVVGMVLYPHPNSKPNIQLMRLWSGQFRVKNLG